MGVVVESMGSSGGSDGGKGGALSAVGGPSEGGPSAGGVVVCIY